MTIAEFKIKVTKNQLICILYNYAFKEPRLYYKFIENQSFYF